MKTNVHIIRNTFEPKKVLLISDAHWDNPKCDRDLLRSHLEKAKEIIEQKNDALHDANVSLEKKVKIRTQQLNLALKELDHFVYRSAHDLRGPITRLLGLSNLGKIETKEKSSLEYFDFIQEVSQEMLQMLARLIRIHEIKGREIVFVTIPIKETVEKVIQSFVLKKTTQEVAFRLDIEENLTIKNDLFLINIIFENIIQNAIQYRKSGKKTIINITVAKTKGQRTAILVNDNGIGIPKEFREKVFEMFFKGTEASLGAGLGLYEVKSIVKFLKGKIRLGETSNKETEFSILLP